MDPVAVFGDFLRPVLEATGFARDGPRWDCGPFSRYEPHVNHDAPEALLKS